MRAVRPLLLFFVVAVPLLAGGPTASAVPSFGLHRLWTQTMTANADSAPVELTHVRMPNGSYRDLLYLVAGNNTANCDPTDPVARFTTYALDAGTGAVVWHVSTTGHSSCTNAGPVLDPSKKFVYAVGLDGKIHKYAVATGKETRTGGWPETYTLIPTLEKVAATPTVGSGNLYVESSGYNDEGHYNGHMVTINLKTGKRAVFNTLCSGIHALLQTDPSKPNYCAQTRGALWGRGIGEIDPVTHDVWLVTGNAIWDGKSNWGESILRMNPAGTKVLDSYTPADQAFLTANDWDLGSDGPALLPPVKQGNHTYHLLVQAGKGPACSTQCGGVQLRLLNRDNLSGMGGPGYLGGDLQDVSSPCGIKVLTAPAVWVSPSREIWVFFANQCQLTGYRLVSPAQGSFGLEPVWAANTADWSKKKQIAGTTPVISQNVLYVARYGEIDAYDLVRHTLLAAATGIGTLHWEYPLVTSNRLFLSDESGKVYAYTINR